MNAFMYMIPKAQLVTVQPSDSIKAVLEKMKKGSYKTLPVVDTAGHFIGVIHESEIYKSYFYDQEEQEGFLNAEIRPLIVLDVEQVEKNTDFYEVILKMEKLNIHFLPVIDQTGLFIGIVTRNKIFEAFESAFGYHKDGFLIEVVSIDAKGQLARLAKAISSTQANIASMVLFDVTVATLERIIVKVETEHIDKVIDKITSEGFRVTSYRYIKKA
jgi:acetoin utilization protein AcuB